jgi:hypothetical protein
MHANLGFLLLQAEVAKPIPWWQVATGILAIPAAVIGLIYTYRLSAKTRLESRKLQLEILEKEGKRPHLEAGVIKQEDLSQSRQAIAARTQDFIVRFIILYLTLVGWDLIKSIMQPFENASIAWLINTHRINTSNNWLTVFWLSWINQVGDFGRWLIYILFGWPLLSDIARSVGLRPPSFFRRHRRRS